MDESNVHTSVVIELANQVDSDGQKMYQIDLNNMSPSKDYVIDQIFCGENVTVYALFEMEEDCEKPSENDFQATTSSDMNEDGKSCRRKSYRTEYLSDLKISDENDDLAPKNISRKESFYCLQQYLDDSEFDEDHSGMKVLYTKEAILRSQKSNGKWLKSTNTRSRGVNTDIALCPKLLDEVQKVIAAGFGGDWRDGATKKEVGDTSKISPRVSRSFMKLNASSSTSSLNVATKSSPNFLLVPLVMTEEGLLKQFRKETFKTADLKIPTLEKGDDETINQKNEPLNMVSGETDVEILKSDNPGGQTCTCKCRSDEGDSEDLKIPIDKIGENIFSRHSILNEIRSVQWKLNSIIQSLESNVSGLTKTELNRSREAVRECFQKISEDFISKDAIEKRSEAEACVATPMTLPEEVKEDRVKDEFEEEGKSVEKDEGVPLFASVSHLPPSRGSHRKKTSCSSPDRTTTRGISATSSVSTTSTTSTYNTFSLRNILESSNHNFKEDFEFFDQNDESRPNSFKKWRGTSVSKSDSNIRLKTCVDFKWPPHPVLKKTQSLDLRQEKTDAFANRKLKNVSHNPDILKAKTHPNAGGNSLPDGLTPNMGDEINIKEKTSKSANPDFGSAAIKEEELISTLKRDILEVQPTVKTQIEDESSKQHQKSPKNRLTLPQLLYKNDKMSVQYCGPNGNTEAVVKSGKVASIPEKVGVKSLKKTIDNRKKTIGEKEKMTSIYSRQRLNVMESTSKRDIPFGRDVRRMTPRRPVEKMTARPDKKDTFDQTKQKLLYRAVKSVVRANPDSKLHIDKLVKSAMENSTEAKTGKQNTEEKTMEKNEPPLSGRPPSQKRRRDVTSSGTPTEKERNASKRNSKPTSTLETQKGSLERILQREKTDQVFVFDKKMDSVFVAKKVEPETNEVEPEKVTQEQETVVEQELQLPQKPVVVELYSKKPMSLDECTSDEIPESPEKNSPGRISCHEKIDLPKPRKEVPEINIMSDEDAEKAIVKSVWALTKVLLYGDGTKKFEILEASLSPPGYSLNNDNINRSNNNNDTIIDANKNR